MGNSNPDQWARIRSGDREALGGWFNENVDAVFSFVFYRVGNDSEAAADITQTTFSEALGRLGDYDPERGSMTAWLRVLSRNHIRRHLNVAKRTIPIQEIWDRIDGSLEKIFSHLDDQEVPDEVLERAETRELVSMTLANLPPKYRDVLDAKYITGETLEAMATSRETTIDAIKSQLRRARAAFKETFHTLATSTEVPS